MRAHESAKGIRERSEFLRGVSRKHLRTTAEITLAMIGTQRFGGLVYKDSELDLWTLSRTEFYRYPAEFSISSGLIGFNKILGGDQGVIAEAVASINQDINEADALVISIHSSDSFDAGNWGHFFEVFDVELYISQGDQLWMIDGNGGVPKSCLVHPTNGC